MIKKIKKTNKINNNNNNPSQPASNNTNQEQNDVNNNNNNNIINQIHESNISNNFNSPMSTGSIINNDQIENIINQNVSLFTLNSNPDSNMPLTDFYNESNAELIRDCMMQAEIQNLDNQNNFQILAESLNLLTSSENPEINNASLSE
jgi:hypothetical protein